MKCCRNDFVLMNTTKRFGARLCVNCRLLKRDCVEMLPDDFFFRFIFQGKRIGFDAFDDECILSLKKYKFLIFPIR